MKNRELIRELTKGTMEDHIILVCNGDEYSVDEVTHDPREIRIASFDKDQYEAYEKRRQTLKGEERKEQGYAYVRREVKRIEKICRDFNIAPLVQIEGQIGTIDGEEL